MARYSITLLPESPSWSNELTVHLRFIYIKILREFYFRLAINFKLPVPEITSFTVIASFVFTSLELIEEVMLNSPTPPEKLAGLPA